MDQDNIGQRLVIRPQRSMKKQLAFVFLSVITVVLSVCLAYFLGYREGMLENEKRVLRLAELESHYADLRQKNAELTFEVAKLDQYKKVQKSAYSELEKTYESVENKNEFLNRRLSFYQSILSPKDGISGLRIHAVKFTEDSANQADFEITLIQSINHQKKMKVKLTVELFDSKESSEPLTNWKSSSNVLVFSYSQIVRGSLFLEPSLRGKFVKITAVPENHPSKQLVEWHQI